MEAVNGFPLSVGIVGGWVFRGSHSRPVLWWKNVTTFFPWESYYE